MWLCDVTGGVSSASQGLHSCVASRRSSLPKGLTCGLESQQARTRTHTKPITRPSSAYAHGRAHTHKHTYTHTHTPLVLVDRQGLSEGTSASTQRTRGSTRLPGPSTTDPPSIPCTPAWRRRGMSFCHTGYIRCLTAWNRRQRKQPRGRRCNPGAQRHPPPLRRGKFDVPLRSPKTQSPREPGQHRCAHRGMSPEQRGSRGSPLQSLLGHGRCR